MIRLWLELQEVSRLATTPGASEDAPRVLSFGG